jgi:hypothetical protein
MLSLVKPITKWTQFILITVAIIKFSSGVIVNEDWWFVT